MIIDAISGVGGGGHTIVDASGTEMPAESKLQFEAGFSVADDNTNNKTVVTPNTDILATKEDVDSITGEVADSEAYTYRQAKGNLADMEIVGGTIAWNQTIKELNSTNWVSETGVTASFSDGVATISSTIGSNGIQQLNSMFPKTHKILVGFSCYGASGLTVRLGATNQGTFDHTISTENTWENASSILNVPDRDGAEIYIVGRNVAYENLMIKNIQLFDLTQMFGATIADYIYALEQANAGDGVAWFRQYFSKDYYAYDAGSLQSVKVNSREVYDANDNLIATYPFDSTKEFRGIPKLVDNKLSYDGDIYKADGTVTRKYGIVDLGTLTWRSIYSSSHYNKVSASLVGIIKPSTAETIIGNIICGKYISITATQAYYEKIGISVNTAGYVRVYDPQYNNDADVSRFTTAMSGVYLVYELATPTTELATSYQNPQRAFIGGTEEFVDAGTRDVAVPVGNNTTYQKNETLPATLDYVDARVGIITFAPIKTFAAATDEEIAWMVKAADEGLIDLYEDCGWRVGQEHKTTLGAIAASGTFDGVSWSVGESQAEQVVTLVLMHRGLYELVTPVLNKDGSARNVGSFVYGLKNALETLGYMNSTNTNVGSWRDSARRGWCNGGFRQAMPEPLRRVSKKFKCITGSYNGSATGGANVTTNDYFALLAGKEVCGGGSSISYSTDNEANALTQFTYYETASNRIKKKGENGAGVGWQERSPYYNANSHFCYIDNDGVPFRTNASNTLAFSPIGVF